MSLSSYAALEELEHRAPVDGFVQFDLDKPIYFRELESGTIRYIGSDAIRVRADAMASLPFWAEARVDARDWQRARAATEPVEVRCTGGRLSNGPSHVCALLTAEGRVIFSEREPEQPDVVYHAGVTLPAACTEHLARQVAASAKPTKPRARDV